MSTRCNIWVDDGKEVIQYYHHWDGYPEGVGEELGLMAKMCLLQVGNEYTSTGSVFNVDNLRKSYTDLLKSVGSYKGENQYKYEGTDLNVHGDIEFLYYVHLHDEGIDITYSKSIDGLLGIENYRNADGIPLF